MRSYEPEFFDAPSGRIAGLGRSLLLQVRSAGRAICILGEACLFLPLFLTRRTEVVRQLYICGVKSFGVTAVMALFTGMIISLQVGIILRNNTGKAEEIGNLVANIMYRELGPMMTGLIVAASVGAAIAAEIATMQVSEEVDALQAMNINPARYLVMPRLMAMIIMLPVLTIYANLIGTLGGMLVADTQLGVSPHLYYNRAIVFLTNYHVYVGLLKSLVFAFIITAVSCHQGFAARNGAIGVGAATRTTVVHSFLLTLVIGYFITWLFY
jgi:phospholipid/cholesterol/gamma-HCH transport system permease protein